MPKLTLPRVLVQVLGGCAEIFADPDVDIWFVDYDNDPHAQVPEEFRTLPPALFPPDSTTSDGGE